VLVVPRGGGQVLLHTKPHYPEEVYRLPTGGIHPDEDAVDAAKREGYEEIGLKVKGLQLLGVLDNVFWLGDEKLVYPSFVFQTKEFTSKPKPQDRDELISGFRDVDVTELRATAFQLASLPGGWRDWGRFRAAAHAWLASRLMNG
jgi:ADP-ribose pyrophosphatase YjhB (NUDIX family)